MVTYKFSFFFNYFSSEKFVDSLQYGHWLQRLHVVSVDCTAIYTGHLTYFSDWKTAPFNLRSSVSTHTILLQVAFHGATLLWTDRMNCKKVGNLATICSGSQVSSWSIRSHSLQWRWMSVWKESNDINTYTNSYINTFFSLTDWLTDWLIDWLIDWLNDWLTGWLADWLIDWRTDRLAGRPTDRPTDPSIDPLTDSGWVTRLTEWASGEPLVFRFCSSQVT